MAEAHLEIAGAHKRTGPGHKDWWYGGGGTGWASRAAALAGVPVSIRPGKTVGIWENGVLMEHWWAIGTTDTDLVPKGVSDLSAYYLKTETYSQAEIDAFLQGVTEVLEFLNFASFPATGLAATLYIDKQYNVAYRWTGTGYIAVSSPGQDLTPYLTKAEAAGLYQPIGNYAKGATVNNGPLVSPDSQGLLHLTFAGGTGGTGIAVGAVENYDTPMAFTRKALFFYEGVNYLVPLKQIDPGLNPNGVSDIVAPFRFTKRVKITIGIQEFWMPLQPV